MDYFGQSQRIKDEFLKSPELMDKLVKHVARRQYAELLVQGRYNQHYRIGQLQSGLWVATRESKHHKMKPVSYPDGSFGGHSADRSLEEEIERLEEYCQRAESEHKSGRYIVTSFCVGVSYLHDGDRIGLILIEDLTKGGLVKIEEADAGDEGIIPGESRRVLFDLSNDIILGNTEKYKSSWLEETKYFDPKNMINLN